MARIGTAIQRPKNSGHVAAAYSTKQISTQLAGACTTLTKRMKEIERNEKNSWAKARNRSIG